MYGYLLGCFALIFIPIFWEHFQRYLKTLPSPQQKPPPASSSTDDASQPNDTCRFPEIATKFDGADETVSAPINSPASKERETRKPWEPPFPKTPYPDTGDSGSPFTEEAQNSYAQSIHVPEHNECEEVQQSMQRQEHLKDKKADAPPRRAFDNTKDISKEYGSSTSEVAQLQPNTTSGRQSPSLLQGIILTLAFLTFLVFSIIMMVHCLAWFLVYKVESRLGEVRTGLLKGGDMRLCLCAKT